KSGALPFEIANGESTEPRPVDAGAAASPEHPELERVGSFLPGGESGRAAPEPGAHHATTDALSPLDQLKVDIHRRLIERLDLEALEEITDEAQLTAQI